MLRTVLLVVVLAWATGCSKTPPPLPAASSEAAIAVDDRLLDEFSGVWRGASSGSLLYLVREGKRLRLYIPDGKVPVTTKVLPLRRSGWRWRRRSHSHHGARGRRSGWLGGAGSRCGRCGRHGGRGHRPCHHAIVRRHSRGCHSGRGRRHAQHLAHFDKVGVVEVVPAGDVFPALAGLQANANQGIPRLDRVVTRFARIFCPGQRLDGGAHHHARLASLRRRRRCGGAPIFHRSLVQAGATAGEHQPRHCHGKPHHKTTRYEHKQFPLGNPRF